MTMSSILEYSSATLVNLERPSAVSSLMGLLIFFESATSLPSSGDVRIDFEKLCPLLEEWNYQSDI
jgi:hypothetical protein